MTKDIKEQKIEIVPYFNNNINSDGIIALQNALLKDYQANANFYMHPTTYDFIKDFKDGRQVKLVYQMKLLNRPIIFLENMSTIKENAIIVAYGDLQKFGFNGDVIDYAAIKLLRLSA